MVKAQPKKAALNRGAWTPEEDKKLTDYVRLHGDHNWRSLPEKAGLKRCGKNCRLRWLNYLRPNIKRGNITEDEEDLIIRLHNLLGNKWSLIARRLPGRTDKEIKDYWNAHLSRRALSTEDLNRKLFINPNFSRQSFQGNDTISAAALMCPLPVRLVPRQKCPDRFAAPATTMMAHENGDTVAHENGDTGGDGVVGAQEKDGGGSSSLDGLGAWLSAWEFNDLDKVIGCEMGMNLLLSFCYSKGVMLY